MVCCGNGSAEEQESYHLTRHYCNLGQLGVAEELFHERLFACHWLAIALMFTFMQKHRLKLVCVTSCGASHFSTLLTVQCAQNVMCTQCSSPVQADCCHVACHAMLSSCTLSHGVCAKELMRQGPFAASTGHQQGSTELALGSFCQRNVPGNAMTCSAKPNILP